MHIFVNYVRYVELFFCLLHYISCTHEALAKALLKMLKNKHKHDLNTA